MPVMKRIYSFIILCFLSSCAHQQQLEQDILQIQEKYELMGGIVVTFDDREILSQIPFGVADLKQNIPVTDQTFFRVASISKTITAMAFMLLVDDEKVSLDDDISEILGYTVRQPDFPQQPITPRMLLSHTSSLVDGKHYDDFLSALAKDTVPPLASLIQEGGRFYSQSNFIQHAPGSFFSYSNINYVILGTLVEKISQQRFDIFCEENLFKPLSIEGSFSVENLSDSASVAVLYRKINGNWKAQADSAMIPIQRMPLLTNYIPGTNAVLFSPQGGLRITATDLSKIWQLILNEGQHKGKQIISPSVIKQMTQASYEYDGTNGDHAQGLFNSWGLGIHRIIGNKGLDKVFEQSELVYGHPGEAYGLVSGAYIDPDKKYGVIFITNGSGKGYQNGERSAFYEVEAAIYQAVSRSLE